MIPGRTLHRLAAHVCNASSLERIVEPAIADLQKEYRAEGRALSRLWILFAGYVAVLKVVAICAFSFGPVHQDERRALMRVLAWSLAMCVMIAVLLILPPLYSFDGAIRGWYAATTLLPQAVPLAIPIGLAFGIAFSLVGRLSANTSRMLLVVALAASVLSLGILRWAMPVANQAFREIAFRELKVRGYDGPTAGPQKGYNEMTFSELRGEITRLSAEGEPRSARQYKFHFHLRVALAAASLSLVSFLLAVPLRRRVLRGLLAFAACLAYWGLIYIGEVLVVYRPIVPALAGAWLPNIVFTASAIGIASSRSSRLRGLLSSS